MLHAGHPSHFSFITALFELFLFQIFSDLHMPLFSPQPHLLSHFSLVQSMKQLINWLISNPENKAEADRQTDRQKRHTSNTVAFISMRFDILWEQVLTIWAKKTWVCSHGNGSGKVLFEMQKAAHVHNDILTCERWLIPILIPDKKNMQLDCQ